MNVDYDSVFGVFKACVQIKMRNRLVAPDELAAYSRNANAPVCSFTVFLDTRGDALISARELGETVARTLSMRGATIVNIEMHSHAGFFTQVYIHYLKVDIM
jgi:hypothetical protein